MRAEKDTPLLEQIRIDQVHMVHDAAPIAFAAAVVNGTILSILVWPVVDHNVVLLWVISLVVVGCLRLFLGIRFGQVETPVVNIWPWVVGTELGTVLTGLIWGAASYFLFVPDSVAYQVILTVFIAGMSAGAVTTLSAQRGPAVAYAIIGLVPLFYRFAQTDHEFTWVMLVMIALFLIMLITTTLRYSRVTNEMFIERFQLGRAQQRDNIRNQVLDMLATGVALDRILEAIILGIEKEFSYMLGSILLLDNKHECLSKGAAPSLPDFYNSAVNGMKIGPEIGSCGSAAYTGKRVVVEDIQTHPYWAKAKRLAAKAGLAACWSEPILSASGEVLGTFAIYHSDVHKPTKQELFAVEQMANLAGIAIERSCNVEDLQQAGMVYQNSSEAMMITDDKDRIIAINPAFTEVTGYSLKDITGKNPRILSSGRQDDEFYRAMWQVLNTTGHWQGEIWNRRKNGEVFAEWLTVNTIFDEDGEVHRRVSLFSDITVKKEADALIRTQANYDTLTKLPNRRLFRDRLEQGIKISKREKHNLAVLFIDLDRFKEVNDTFGHHIGDELLVAAAQRITDCVRESDTVARLGGDEFVVILTELKGFSTSGIDRIAQTIIETLSEPYHVKEEMAYVTASIGITLYPDDAATAEDLLRNADQAMFDAKQKGRNRYSYFTRHLQEDAQRRMRLINDMHQALDKDEFNVYYQPIIDIASGRIVKAEALLRWLHPQYGYISPASFIPIAEETGAIHEIGNMVFKKSVKSVIRWRESYDPHFQVSINKSPVQFMQESHEHEDWVGYMNKAGLAGAGLVIEITEGVVMQLSPNINERLLALRDAGVQVAIDDFGTGYSSLAYLKRFDIDYLKLDRSFVSNLETDASDLVLSEAIVVMAHKLGFSVIAEGVETEAQLRILDQIGCDYAQGFLFSKAVPVAEFEQLLHADSKCA